MGEVALEAGAEVDVPTPEAAQGRFGVLVVLCPETASFAGKFLFCHIVQMITLLIYEIFRKSPCKSNIYAYLCTCIKSALEGHQPSSQKPRW